MVVSTAMIVQIVYYVSLALIFKLQHKNANFALINWMAVNFVLLTISVLNAKMDTIWILQSINAENVQQLFSAAFHAPIIHTAHYANIKLIFPQRLINV